MAIYISSGFAEYGLFIGSFTAEPVSPPVMPGNVSVSIPENTTLLSGLGEAISDEPVTYSIAGGADAAKFEIDPETGEISFKEAPDYDDPGGSLGNTYIVWRTASNSGGEAAAPQIITVNVTNVADYDIPNAYSFTAVTNANPGQIYTATAVLSGFESGVTLTAVTFQLSNNGTTWSSSVSGIPGVTQVRATVTASGTSEGVQSQSGSVNGVAATFTVTTRYIDTTPDAYTFTPAVDIYPGATASAMAPISGVESGVTLTAITFDLSNDFGENWASSVSYIPGATFVRASGTASGVEGDEVVVTGSVNGVDGSFSITTLIFDTDPDPIKFATVFTAAPGATVYGVRRITGVTPGVELEAIDFELSNDNRVTWTDKVTFIPGITYVRATAVASEVEGEYVESTGTVNGVEGTFRVRTRVPGEGSSGMGSYSLISGLTFDF